MPTYSYRCPECGHEYEKIQRFTDNSRAKCPECGARGERVITGGGGLIFKGSGFYITDYQRAPEKAKAEATEESGGKKAEKPEPKSDSAGKSPSKKGDKS